MKNKIIFKITIIFIVIISIVTYYNIFILHNYMISFKIPCDPKTESCFVVECEPASNENCTNYYKLIERKASEVISCSNGDFQCLACKENEKKCSVIFCDPKDVENICSNVEK